MLGLPAATPAEGVASYAAAVVRLREAVRIEPSFQTAGVDEQAYLAALPRQALAAFDDQCAPANPRMPMLDNMRELVRAAYYGTPHTEQWLTPPSAPLPGGPVRPATGE